ncbi:hypothetical protein OPKNFCMD_0149 [Methylobacterium crusticola]|uniref:Uncharacterized protein n=1 Tax=Methylobacterium crusticola TaxID=1697972 RepID=A0ABQ4QQU3_9HYPH|nr:hypothetical protein [Methylobacterium crusticola]GJD47441.1 hypothetical protein OPKNFCMD_0149 [Methylobacterium crusticola]
MPRPHEAVADAIRTARAIVAHEGAALAAAAHGADEAALEAAGRDLASRIAQAILDAEREAAERLAGLRDADAPALAGTGFRLTA